MRLRSADLLRAARLDTPRAGPGSRRHSQASLASVVGCTRQFLSGLERGRELSVGDRTAEALAAAVGMPVGRLFVVPDTGPPTTR